MPSLIGRYEHSIKKAVEPELSVGVSAGQPYHDCAGGCGVQVRANKCSPCAEQATREWMTGRTNRPRR